MNLVKIWFDTLVSKIIFWIYIESFKVERTWSKSPRIL